MPRKTNVKTAARALQAADPSLTYQQALARVLAGEVTATQSPVYTWATVEQPATCLVTNSCICSYCDTCACSFQDSEYTLTCPGCGTEGRFLDGGCGGSCWDDMNEDFANVLGEWLARVGDPDRVRVDGSGMGWQRESGWTECDANADEVVRALSINGDFRLTFTLAGESLRAVRSSHDEMGAAFTITAVGPEQRVLATDNAGRFEDGYTDDDVNRVLGEISDAAGVRVVCVWDFIDSFGPGGNSEFFVETGDGFVPLSGDLWAWLNEAPGSEHAVATPGDPATWVSSDPDETLRVEDLVGDDWHNYAREDRTQAHAEPVWIVDEYDVGQATMFVDEREAIEYANEVGVEVRESTRGEWEQDQ
jgi:hypothetical protein